MIPETDVSFKNGTYLNRNPIGHEFWLLLYRKPGNPGGKTIDTQTFSWSKLDTNPRNTTQPQPKPDFFYPTISLLLRTPPLLPLLLWRLLWSWQKTFFRKKRPRYCLLATPFPSYFFSHNFVLSPIAEILIWKKCIYGFKEIPKYVMMDWGLLETMFWRFLGSTKIQRLWYIPVTPH